MKYTILLILMIFLSSCGLPSKTDRVSKAEFCVAVGEIGFDSVQNKKAGLPLSNSLHGLSHKDSRKEAWLFGSIIAGYSFPGDASDLRDSLTRMCMDNF